MKKIFFTILLLPLLSFAQEGGEITIGEQTVVYDQMEVTEAATYYYSENNLVASEHGAISFVYENDAAVLEAHDTDGDGTLDAFIKLSADAQEVEVTGAGANAFQTEEPVEFADLVAERGGSEAAAPTDSLVENIDAIKIPSYHNWKLYIITVIFIAAAYWWHRRKNKK